MASSEQNELYGLQTENRHLQEMIGAAQALNKKTGRFTPADRRLLEAMTTQAAIALQSMPSSSTTSRT